MKKERNIKAEEEDEDSKKKEKVNASSYRLPSVFLFVCV